MKRCLFAAAWTALLTLAAGPATAETTAITETPEIVESAEVPAMTDTVITEAQLKEFRRQPGLLDHGLLAADITQQQHLLRTGERDERGRCRYSDYRRPSDLKRLETHSLVSLAVAEDLKNCRMVESSGYARR